MKPGFLSLFSRSHYRSSASRLRALGLDSVEAQRLREERERFAAAAIAFCLHHDEVFLKHFWVRVCCDGQGQRSAATPSVEIEPRHWSDLLVSWEGNLCAVEIKNGAELKDHQNPAKSAFTNPGGYGRLLSGLCRDRRCCGRYVVLGWGPGILPDEAQAVRGLKIAYRNWTDLLDDLPDSPLTSDLTSLLSAFGVWEFTFRAMRGKRLSGRLGEFGRAVTILESVRDHFGWPRSAFVEADFDQLGIYLKGYYRQKPVRGLAERLWAFSGQSRVENDLIWIGYLERNGESAQRCVYLYCAKGRRPRIIARMHAAGYVVDDQPGSDRDGQAYCVVVWEGNEQLDDINWFNRALEVAGGLAGKEPKPSNERPGSSGKGLKQRVRRNQGDQEPRRQ